uniref:Uncharacterized protein n=1 Tax=Lactuca sativa TaxID=4236 RepID=A0A9R1VI95_LACSA|nr:hypothetical protein LSAT_V11C500260750 [Lactuca sativa]
MFFPGFIHKHTFQSPQKFLIITIHKYLCQDEDIEDFYPLHLEDQLPLSTNHGYLGIKPVEFLYNRYFCMSLHVTQLILCLFDHDKCNISQWNPSNRCKLMLHDFPECPKRHFFDCELMPHKIRRNCKKFISLCHEEGLLVRCCFSYAFFFGVISKACFVNGNVIILERHYILAFDLSTHVFGMIPFPEPSCKIIQLTTI